jgi:ribosomal protein S18 acetylase RimI-like enzyme
MLSSTYLAITRDLLMPVLRQALDSDVKDLSDLVCNSFVTFASADWSSAATEKLVADSSPEAMLTALKGSHFSKVALSNNQIVGMVLFSKPNVMKMLFVSPDMTRRGFGRLLWESARESVEKSEPAVSTIELNSTTFAIPFYQSVGFVPVSTKFEIEGVIMTRMVCWLRARDFDAEL